MEGFTVTFTGNETELKSTFFPPLELDGEYLIGLVDFQSYNSIYNVKKPLNKLYYYEVQKVELPKGSITLDELNVILKDKMKILVQNNKYIPQIKFHVKIVKSKGFGIKLNRLNISKDKKITIDEEDDFYYYDNTALKEIEIPEGSYEIPEISKEIEKQIPSFVLTTNNRTMKAYLTSDVVFNFVKPSIGTYLLGFKGLSTPFTKFESATNVNVNNVNSIRIKCNIANGSYLNGRPSHTIHNFYPQSPPGYKIIEVPRNIIYFPINKRTIDEITITFADQDDRQIDFNGEEVTLTCHIKKL